MLVIGALLFDLGRPNRVWHPLIMWNPHSVMLEVGWCVTLYSIVLALEFSPMVFERFRMKRALKVVHFVMLPLVVMGVLLSTLHQSSLGSFYLIVPSKLYPLWYTPWLPVFFFLTALMLGCAMTIVESFISARAFKKEIEMGLLADLGKVTLVLVGVNLLAKYQDLLGPWGSAAGHPTELRGAALPGRGPHGVHRPRPAARGSGDPQSPRGLSPRRC